MSEPVERKAYATPNGRLAEFYIRGSANDGALIAGILGEDEYQLKDLDLEGWALDIGAHVGTVGIALAIDHPRLRVIAVEPVPDNAELIRQSVSANGLADRVFVEEAAAGSGQESSVQVRYAYTSHTIPDQGYVEQNRFIGNLWRDSGVGTTIAAPVVSIASLAEKYEVDEFRFCKIDCEGCEWQFFKNDTDRLAEIIGEWHDAPFSRIKSVLKGHKVTLVTDYGGSGIFRAIRR